MDVSRVVAAANDAWTGSRRLRGAIVAAVCLALCWVFVTALNRYYSVEDWLFWKIARIWLYCALESAACVSVGHWILVRVLKLADRSALETLYLAFAVGQVAVCMAMYLGGALGLYSWPFAIALVAGGIGLGFLSLRASFERWRREETAAPPAVRPLTHRLIGGGALTLAIVALVFVYLQLMTPQSINFDAAWVHLTIPQDYARHGRMVPFVADYARSMPHLASLMHTWGWVMPGLTDVERWMMALHEEFFVLLWTLAGVAAAARWLIGEKTGRTWTAFFLFPSIFVYDQNIGGAADHYVALFAPAILICTGRLLESWSRTDAVLLGISGAGAMLTKYQTAYLLAPAAGLILVRWVHLTVRTARARRESPSSEAWRATWSLARVPLLALGVFVVLVSPHFIKNAVYYHNPFYPFMQSVFTESRPHVRDGALLVNELFKDKLGLPPKAFGERFWSSLRLLFTVPFETHYAFWSKVPNFGPLFVFTLPLLLLAPRTAKSWLGAFIGMGYVLCWAMTFRVDRNLQPVVPIMASVTAALLVAAWELGILARVGLSCLVLLNVVWEGDALFYSGNSRIAASIEMIRDGYEGQVARRFAFRNEFTRVNAAVPRNAKIVLHNARLSLGIDRDILMDWPGQQGLISYSDVPNPAAMYGYYRSLGVTHLLSEPSRRPGETVQDDVLFNGFVRLYGVPRGHYGAYQLTELPRSAPPTEPTPYRVLALGVSGYRDGLYRLDRMTGYARFPAELRRYPRPEQVWPKQPEPQASLIAEANALVIGGRGRQAPSIANACSTQFELAVQYASNYSIYVRSLRAEP